MLWNLFSWLRGAFQTLFASSCPAASYQSQVSCLHLLGKVLHQPSLSQVSWSWSESWSVSFPHLPVFIHMYTPCLLKPGLTARAAPEGRQSVETGTSRAGSALAALVLDCLYTGYSPPLPMFIQQRVNNSYWHLWVQLQNYKAHCCSSIAIHLLFFCDHSFVLWKNITLFIKLDFKIHKHKEFNSIVFAIESFDHNRWLYYFNPLSYLPVLFKEQDFLAEFTRLDSYISENTDIVFRILNLF